MLLRLKPHMSAIPLCKVVTLSAPYLQLRPVYFSNDVCNRGAQRVNLELEEKSTPVLATLTGDRY